jgi:hypothetical protein
LQLAAKLQTTNMATLAFSYHVRSFWSTGNMSLLQELLCARLVAFWFIEHDIKIMIVLFRKRGTSLLATELSWASGLKATLMP